MTHGSIRRPGPARVRGAVASALAIALGVGLAACESDQVDIDEVRPAPGARAAKACTALLDDLPNAVSGELRRPVEKEGSGAAWGDPAIVLRCGVARPRAQDASASCQVANGVGWFVPEETIEDQSADVVLTTIGRFPRVEVAVPAQYRPPAAVMVDLAQALKQYTREWRPCV